MNLRLTYCAIIVVVAWFSGCDMDFSYDEIDFSSQTDNIGGNWDTGSASDVCPDDPTKTISGTDGCGEPDTSSDSLSVGAKLVTASVSSRFDDAEETVVGNAQFLKGNVIADSSDLEMTDDADFHGSAQIVGLRFSSVPVPDGAVIEQAFVEFVANESDSQQTSLTISMVAADNPAAFIAKRFNLSARPQVEAVVQWVDVIPWVAGETYKTPDLAAVLQQVVDRAGWKKGNAVVVLVRGTGLREAVSYDGSPQDAPVLHVVYR